MPLLVPSIFRLVQQSSSSTSAPLPCFCCLVSIYRNKLCRKTFNFNSCLAFFLLSINHSASQGGVIRQELYYLLKDEKDVHFTFGSVQAHGINQAGQGMGSSKFCLNIAGDTPSSNRLFDAIASHCVPVVISDEIELPFEDVLDYSEFCIFVRASDAVKKGYVLNLLRGISQDKWTGMWE